MAEDNFTHNLNARSQYIVELLKHFKFVKQEEGKELVDAEDGKHVVGIVIGLQMMDWDWEDAKNQEWLKRNWRPMRTFKGEYDQLTQILVDEISQSGADIPANFDPGPEMIQMTLDMVSQLHDRIHLLSGILVAEGLVKETASGGFKETQTGRLANGLISTLALLNYDWEKEPARSWLRVSFVILMKNFIRDQKEMQGFIIKILSQNLIDFNSFPKGPID